MNVVRCQACKKDFIEEEFSNHQCQPQNIPIERIVTLYYFTFIPLKIDGKDVALLTSEDGKTLYNIKPSPRVVKHPQEPRDDEIAPKSLMKT